MSTVHTLGWKVSARGSKQTIDRHGNLKTSPRFRSEHDEAEGENELTIEAACTIVTEAGTSSLSGISGLSLL